MKKLFGKIDRRKLLTNLLLLLYLMIIHTYITTGTNDDAWFGEILDKYSLFEYLDMRYYQWTSRLLIEIPLLYLSRWNPLWWKVLNILFTYLLIYSCSRAFSLTTKGRIFFMLLVPLIPASMLSSAGWISTTLNYLWPVAAAIYCLIPLRKWLDNEELASYEKVLLLPASIFACSQELCAAILFAAYLLFAAYCIYHKKNLKFYWFVMLFICMAMILFALTCPGNAVRSIQETSRWFPEYATLNLGEKVLIGYLQAFSCHITMEECNMLFFFFTWCLFGTVYLKSTENSLYQKAVLRMAAAFPFVITLFGGLGVRVLERIQARFQINFRVLYWLKLFQNNHLPDMGGYPVHMLIIECIMFLLVLLSIIYCLYYIWGKSDIFLVTLSILFLAPGSRVIMGFSPTVYVSGMRTALPSQIGFMILTLLCIEHIFMDIKGSKLRGVNALGYIGVLALTMITYLK